MSDFTPLLGLPYLLSNQAQKHVTLNESLRALDGLLHLSVLGRGLSVPPVSPSEGDRYLVAASASGDWTSHDGKLALFSDGGWIFLAPRTGWRAWIEDEALFLVYDGANWVDTTSDELQNLQYLGLGATADANNPFLAKLNAALFTALETGSGGTGDLRYKLNKEASGNVLSLLLQTNYTTYAEVGLVGDNDLLFKVSPDGSTFYEGIRIDKDTGEVSFPNGSSDIREKLTANTTFYVDASTGSDSNDGLTPGTAFLTLQAALDHVCSLDIGNNTITIQLAAGSYAGATPRGPFVGSGSVRICGDATTPSNVVVGSGSGYGLNVDKPMRVLVEGCQFIGTVSGLRASGGGVIVINDHISLGACGTSQLEADGSGSSVISAGENIDFDGGAAFALRAIFGGYIRATGGTYTYSGAWNYSNKFAQAFAGGVIYATASTFAGSYASVTGQRYVAQALGVIQTSGAGVNYFPGSVAGTTVAGGQYV